MFSTQIPVVRQAKGVWSSRWESDLSKQGLANQIIASLRMMLVKVSDKRRQQERGECKPETFDFLGFTFYCSKTRKGSFVPKVQTSRKKFEQKVRAYKNWIYDNRNRPMREIIKELNVKIIGHYRYYGVTWNFRKITTFQHRVQQFRFKAMNRRGCRRAYTWNGFVEMLKYYPLAKPKTYYCLY